MIRIKLEKELVTILLTNYQQRNKQTIGKKKKPLLTILIIIRQLH